MSLRSKFKKVLGLLPQEYVCLALEDIQDGPSVSMTIRGSLDTVDVTTLHVLLGYKPLVIAIRLDSAGKDFQAAADICLSFSHRKSTTSTQWRGYHTATDCVARVEMTKINDELAVPGLAVYVGKYGEQSFLPLHQLVANKWIDRLRRQSASDANLDGNLYDQVRIAYSIPRAISVITVKDNDLLNFFPTDLHGSIGGDYYLSSLRIGGMACTQVEQLRRIVISKVDVAAFKRTYELGKNHMKEPQPAASFEPTFVLSPSGIPVYPHATTYCELEWIRHWDVGIHRIFLYKTIGKGEVKSGKTLAHIHRYYAQWRLNQGLSAEYFYR